jgi:hypothetical protein
MKRCCRCGLEKSLDDFYRLTRSRDGYTGVCRACINADRRRWRQQNPDRARKTSVRHRLIGKSRDPRLYWAKRAFIRVRCRARERNLSFSLTLEELVAIAPHYCPLLGIPLDYGANACDRSSLASVDRLDSGKGYTKDNIWVISNRANTIKNNATIDELRTLVKSLRDLTPDH